MLKTCVDLLFRYRHFALGAYIVITAFFLYFVFGLNVSTVFDDLIPYTHPYIKVYQQYGGVFGTPLTVVVEVEVKEGDVFNVHTLQKIRRITRELDAIPGVNHNQVISITTPRVKRVESTGQGIDVGALIGPTLPETEEELARVKARAETTEGVTGVLVSPDSKAALITASFFERLIDYALVFERVNQIIREEQDDRHSVYAAGQPMLTGWVYHYQREMYTIFGLGFLTMVALLTLYFRNFAGVVAPVVVAAVSAVWGFGFAGLLGYNLDPLIIVVPVLLVARSLSHSVQMCERFFEIYREVQDVKRASSEALVSLFPPGVVSIVTDSAGLFIIAIAPFRLIEKLGYMCGLWALSILFSVVLLSPLVLSYLPAPKNADRIVLARDRKGGFLSVVFRFLALFSSTPRWAAWTLAFFVGISLLFGLWASKLDIGHVTPGTPLLWPDSFHNVSVKKINQRFLGTDELHIVAEGERPDAIKEPHVLRSITDLQAHMEGSRLVSGTLSVADYLAMVNRYLNGGFPKWDFIPNERRWTGSLYQMLIAGSNPGDWDRFFTPDFKTANIIVWFKDHHTDTVKEALRRAKDFVVRENASLEGAKFRLASGTVGLIGAANEVLGEIELKTVILISLVIFVTTSFVYRSVIAGLLLLLISNIANLMTSAVMFQLGIGLDVNTLPIASVGMGIGIDYNIYLMSRMCEEYRVDPDYARLVPVSIYTTGKAIFFTATTMIAGLVLWYFMSSLRFQADMGLLLTAVMLAHVALALIFQAAVMRILQPGFIAKKTLIQRG